MQIYYMDYLYSFYKERDWLEHPVPQNIYCKPQVVAATIKSPLSRKREQESEPARLVHHYN